MSEHSEQNPEARHPPKPIIKKMRWPYPFIWLIPVLAAALAGYYYYDRIAQRGPEITLKFTDASAIKPGETQVVHLGVPIGQVTGIELSPDKKQALVKVLLERSQSAFANKGSVFWIVRPEISAQEISGLGTVLSGPIVNANPGDGEPQGEFTGLPKPPAPVQQGISIILRTISIDHIQPGSLVTYHGIEVGSVQSIALADDATGVDVHVIIQTRYIPLVRANSQFWVVSAVDLKGGLFTGVQMKVESLRSLLAGSIAFATPDQNMGLQAVNGSSFLLHDESKSDWLTWAPKIPLQPEDTTNPDDSTSLPQAPQSIRSSVGPK